MLSLVRYPTSIGAGGTRQRLSGRFLLMMDNQATPPPQTQVDFQTEGTVHFHYNHTDSCRFSRWTAKECFEFMYARPWQKVNDFYLDMTNGRLSLLGLFGKETCAIHDGAETVEDCNEPESVSVPAGDRTGRWARVTFKIDLSYHGSSFDGWQKQPSLNTVQGLVEQSLGRFIDDKKAQQLKDKNLPLEGCAVVAGRTDKGVSAFKQVVSFYTWRKDVRAQDIKHAINVAAPGKIGALSVNKVSREFHPNFSAKWRRYLYIFPFNEGDAKQIVDNGKGNKNSQGNGVFLRDYGFKYIAKENVEDVSNYNEDEAEIGNKPTSFEVSKVNQLLRQLEGKLLSYKMFARDTKASRNVGPPTECFVFHARAAEASLSAEDENCTKIMCIELVANRFLRKMVRVLVATAIREAAAGAEEDGLLKLMDATCRRATAPPAPPDGLCLVDVGYMDYDKRNCLIA